MLEAYGLTWPWESLHIEALAWFDHWLKGRDTGVFEGPPIRYRLPGADGWRVAESWPHRESSTASSRCGPTAHSPTTPAAPARARA